MSRSRFTKITINLAILAAWGILMFFLMEKEGILRTQSDQLRFGELIPESLELDSWKGIYVDDRWIGYSHTSFGPSLTGYRISSSSYLRFKMFDEIKDLTIIGAQELDHDRRLARFEVRISGIAGVVIIGRRVGPRLLVDVSYGDTIFHQTFDAADDLLLDQSLLQAYRGHDLKVNDSYRLRVLNPLTLKEEDVTVRVVKKEGKLSVMETRFAGLVSRSWIDEKGMVVREETPNGWIIKAETEENVKRHLARSRTEAVDILSQVSVTTERKIADPRSTTYMKVRITGYDLDDLPSDGRRQRITDSIEGIVTISAEAFDEARSSLRPSTDGLYEQYLKPSAWIDSEDPKIVAKAQSIVGAEKNSWRAAVLIHNWIYKNLDKKLSPELPIATTVLETMRGDCNEHTSLFVALARAAGIPARMVAGLVWARDAFYYHAWPSVYVGKWIHLDPTLGQQTADATHIELVSGDFSAQSKIALAMGKIGIEILESNSDRIPRCPQRDKRSNIK